MPAPPRPCSQNGRVRGGLPAGHSPARKPLIREFRLAVAFDITLSLGLRLVAQALLLWLCFSWDIGGGSLSRLGACWRWRCGVPRWGACVSLLWVGFWPETAPSGYPARRLTPAGIQPFQPAAAVRGGQPAGLDPAHCPFSRGARSASLSSSRSLSFVLLSSFRAVGPRAPKANTTLDYGKYAFMHCAFVRRSLAYLAIIAVVSFGGPNIRLAAVLFVIYPFHTRPL